MGDGDIAAVLLRKVRIPKHLHLVRSIYRPRDSHTEGNTRK